MLSLIWGGSFLFGRIAVLEVMPLTVVFFRVAIAAATLWIYLLLSARKPVFEIGFLKDCLILGLLNNVIPFSFILFGQTEIGAGLAAIVNAMTPIWTLIFANWLTQDEKLNTQKILGILIGFCGVGLMMSNDIWQGLQASALAQASILVATISYAFASIFAKRFKNVDPAHTATGQLTASTFLILPIMLAIENPNTILDASASAIFSILMLAIFCTAIAYILFFKILASAGAVKVSLVTFLVPVSAIILGILFLDEHLNIYQISGMTLIALGLALVDGKFFTSKIHK